MKNNQMTSVLIMLVFLSTLASAGLIGKYYMAIHTLQRLAPQLPGPTAAQNVMRSLFNDTVQYEQATKSPELVKILEAVPGAKVNGPATHN